MSNFLTNPGFLGTTAPLRSDITLIMIIVTAILFTIGWRLAVQKRYQAHRWVQTVTAVLNAIVVVLTMVTIFIQVILPGVPGKLLEGSYGVTTVHALVGTIGVLLGLFVVLRGNDLVPKGLRFSNYKLFMRTSYILYMLSTLGGITVYIFVYIFGK